MNELRKEQLRLANVALEIQERDITLLQIDFSNYGIPVRVTEYLLNNMNLSIGRQWEAHNSRPEQRLENLREIRLELEQVLREGKAKAKARAGEAA